MILDSYIIIDGTVWGRGLRPHGLDQANGMGHCESGSQLERACLRRRCCDQWTKSWDRVLVCP